MISDKADGDTILDYAGNNKYYGGAGDDHHHYTSCRDEIYLPTPPSERIFKEKKGSHERAAFA